MLKKNLYGFSAFLALSCGAYAMDPLEKEENPGSVFKVTNSEKRQIEEANETIKRQLEQFKNLSIEEYKLLLTEDERVLFERIEEKFKDTN